LRDVVLHNDAPTIFVEHKLLYPIPPEKTPPFELEPVSTSSEGEGFPHLAYAPAKGISPDVTIVTYGHAARHCEVAMRDLFVEEELAFDYFIFTQLWPLQGMEEVVASVRGTGRLVVVEEGYAQYGFAAAISSEIAERVPGAVVGKVGSKNVPIPCARHLEDDVLPDSDDVFDAVSQIMRKSGA